MKWFRDWLEYSRKVSSTEIVPKNPLCFEVQKYMKKFYVWRTEESWKEMTVKERIIQYALMVNLYTFWFLVNVHLVNSEKIDWELFAAAAVAWGGSACTWRFTLYFWKRKKLTGFLKLLDAKVQVARKEASPERLKKELKIYVFLIWIIAFSLSNIVVWLLFSSFYTIFFNQFMYKMALPFESPHFSFVWWAEIVVNNIATFSCIMIQNSFEVMTMDSLIQMAFLYRVQYEKIRSLSGTDAHIKRQICEICRELGSIKK